MPQIRRVMTSPPYHQSPRQEAPTSGWALIPQCKERVNTTWICMYLCMYCRCVVSQVGSPTTQFSQFTAVILLHHRQYSTYTSMPGHISTNTHTQRVNIILTVMLETCISWEYVLHLPELKSVTLLPFFCFYLLFFCMAICTAACTFIVITRPSKICHQNARSISH